MSCRKNEAPDLGAFLFLVELAEQPTQALSLGCLWVVSMIKKKGVDAESLGAVEKSDFSTCSTCLLELY